MTNEINEVLDLASINETMEEIFIANTDMREKSKKSKKSKEHKFNALTEEEKKFYDIWGSNGNYN